jgi:NAD(P)H dehydrogenase (quinone)
MRNLVVFAHPRASSFNGQILQAYCAAVLARGHEIEVRDLYAMGFDPVLTEADLASFRGQRPLAADIAQEQTHVRWAELITVISPVWWIGWPAILKGWIDRVFSFDFAYGYGPTGTVGLLEGRRAIVIATTGSNEAHWAASGKLEAVRVAQDVGTFELSGISMLEHVTLSPVGRKTAPDAFASYLDQVTALVGRHLPDAAAGAGPAPPTAASTSPSTPTPDLPVPAPDV